MPFDAEIRDEESVLLVLKRSRALIATNWGKMREVREIDGIKSYCAVGAIKQFSRSTSQYKKAIDAVWANDNSIKTLFGMRSLGLMLWNDAQPDRSYVLHVFDKAIANLEREIVGQIG